MRDELEQLIYQKYPDMFKNYSQGLPGDGWFNIIDQLCSCIQNHINWRNKAIDDYTRRVATGEEIPEWMRKQNREPIRQVVVAQVKEKYGTLRFYYDGGDEYIRGMVTIAESMSAVTCEDCGAPGELRSGGWLRTLCSEHALKV